MKQYTDGDLKLILATQTHKQDLDVIWMEGYAHGSDELTDQDNPYPKHSREAQFWDEGWVAAFYEENPLFPEQEVEPVHIYSEDVAAANDKMPAWKKAIQDSKAWIAAAGVGVLGIAVFMTDIIELSAA